MPAKSIEINFKATGNVEEALKRQGLTAEQTARKMKELAEVPRSSRNGSGGRGRPGPGNADEEDDEDGGLKGIADALGSRRLLSRIAGGGIAGFIGSELDSMAGKAAEVADQFRKGEVDAKGLAVALGESIPFIGGFIHAGQEMREALTGEKVEIERITEESKLQNQVIEYRQGLYEGEKKRVREIDEIIRGTEERQRRAGLVGSMLEDFDRHTGAANRFHALDQKRQQEIDAANAAATKQLDALDKQALEHSFDPAMLATISAAESEVKKAHAKDLLDINSKYWTAKIAESNASVTEENDALAKSAKKASDIILKYHDETNLIETQARADHLRAVGRDGEAELLLIRTQAKEKKDAIDQALQEQSQTMDQRYTEYYKREAERRKQAIDDAASAEAQASAKKRQAEIDKLLDSHEEDRLHDELDSAKGFSDRLRTNRAYEKKKLEDEFKEREREVGEILHDPRSTETERREGIFGLRNLAEDSGRNFDAGTRGKDDITTQELSPLIDSATLTGVIEESRMELAHQNEYTYEHGYRKGESSRTVNLGHMPSKDDTQHSLTKQAIGVQQQLLDAFKQFVQQQAASGVPNYVVGAGIN